MENMEKLFAQISAYAPKLTEELIKRATANGVVITQYLEDSKVNYVIGYKEKKPIDKLINDWYAYFDKEEAEQNKGADDIVITEYGYILIMFETEKTDRKPFEKWGYEFSINEDGSVSIRRTMGKRITIQVDVANKITLVQASFEYNKIVNLKIKNNFLPLYHNQLKHLQL